MSTVVPPKGHRHTRSAAAPPATASSKNPQNPHHLNVQSHTQNSQSEMSDSVTSNPTTPPRTPRRNDQSYQNQATNSTGNEYGSKQKSRNKNRPKNAVTSPAATRNDRHTPPLRSAPSVNIPSSAKPISTPSSTAYAGLTFHASPAPSALPIPSFYSKSVPDSPGIQGLKKDSPTPPVPASNAIFQANTQHHRGESPLDVFFRADREEKERARSANSAQHAVTASGPFQPPSQSPRVSQTPPAPSSHNHARHGSKASPGGIFAMELDCESGGGTQIGPAFSTPYAERINAARSRQPASHDTQAAMDRSEALKAYLFSGQPPSSPGNSSTIPFNPHGSASPQTPTSSATYQNPPGPLSGSRSSGLPPRPHHGNYPFSYDPKMSAHAPRTSGRSSGLRQEVTPTRTPTKTPERNNDYSNSPTPSRTYGNTSFSDTNDFIGKFKPHTASTGQASPHSISSGSGSADIQGMEQSLRRILKLEPAGSSGVTGSGIGGVPAATASVPNHVGGGPQPMNGMQNGVMGS